jgi:heptosyltransferase-3
MNIKVKKILVIRTDRLGDVLLTLPLVEQLKNKFPESIIHFLCQSYTAELLQYYHTIDNIIIYKPEEEHSGIKGVIRMANLLRAGEYDLVIHALPRFELALAAYLAGIKYRLGTAFRWFSFLFNLRHYEHRKKNIYHEADCNLRLLQKIGIPFQKNADFKYFFKFTREDHTHVSAILRERKLDSQKFIIVHPGSGGSALNWPVEHYWSLIDLMNQKSEFQVVLTGTENERNEFLQKRIDNNGQYIDLYGQFSLAQLAVFVSQAALFISNSTGPLHLAVTMGTPVLGFYPELLAMNPTRWGPYQRENLQSLTPKDIHSDYTDQMEKITPEIVVERIKVILKI